MNSSHGCKTNGSSWDLRVRIHKKADQTPKAENQTPKAENQTRKSENQTPKSENQNVAGELQPEKVQTSFLISGWMTTRSLGENLGGIISFSLLRNLSPGRTERTLIRLSALFLSRSSWRCWSQKEFHMLLVGFSRLLTGKFLSPQD